MVDRALAAEVVVCTRNRARLLAQACEAILAQDFPQDLWRLVIVDNASTDETHAVAKELERRFAGRIKAVQEPQIGHCAARNRGIQSTSAPIVAFTDDDAMPDRTWLRTLVKALTSSDALAAGGPVDPVFPVEMPKWFVSDFFPYLAVWRCNGAGDLTYNEYPRGVNLAFRRKVFDRFGLFNTSLGLRAGRSLYCDEVELCLRIERAGGRIVYSPHSIVRHCIEPERLTVDWITGRFAAQGRSEAIVNWIHGGWRGLLLGLNVHLRNIPAVPWEGLAPRHPGLTALELKQAAAVMTRCQRLALGGYLRQAGAAILRTPRYRALDGSACATGLRL
jgi:glycosyltransferase involved in cell wall biosynthesis